MQLSTSTLLFLTSCLAILPLHSAALSWHSDLRRADLPDLPYPPNNNAATCSRDGSNTFSLSLVPDTPPSVNVLSTTKSSRAVVMPRAGSEALPHICRQLTSFFFPSVPYRFFKLGIPPLLPGNVYILSIRTPANKRIDEISAHLVMGTTLARGKMLGTSTPMSSVGTLQIIVPARAEVRVMVVFQEGNTPGEIALFALGTAQDPSATWPDRFGPNAPPLAKT